MRSFVYKSNMWLRGFCLWKSATFSFSRIYLDGLCINSSEMKLRRRETKQNEREREFFLCGVAAEARDNTHTSHHLSKS